MTNWPSTPRLFAHSPIRRRAGSYHCYLSFVILPPMTAANKITLARIGLIPAFVWLAWAYGRSFSGG
ncbi:MAG: hypothetical protein JOZ31_15520, partial [Verrucomicrobia bacterium]|nr:hypothetical protein [Verrucomicrobiota bacterium]